MKVAELLRRVTRAPATDTSVWSDGMRIVDSTPVECGRSRETVKRSDLAGWAEYGYCASHSRFFWGLRLHLVCTLQGLPIAYASTGTKADERETLLDLLAAEPGLVAGPAGERDAGNASRASDLGGSDATTGLTVSQLTLCVWTTQALDMKANSNCAVSRRSCPPPCEFDR